MKKRLFVILVLVVLSIFFKVNVIHASYSGLAFTSDPGNWVGQGESFTTVGRSTVIEFSISPPDGGFHVWLKSCDPNATPFWYHLDLASPDFTLLKVGEYTEATKYPNSLRHTNGLSFSSATKENEFLYGDFNVLEATYTRTVRRGMKIESFAADFRQFDLKADGSPDFTKGLFGQVRYNSDIPFRTPEPTAFILLLGGIVSLIAFKKSNKQPR